jgi:hypothetical protein
VGGATVKSRFFLIIGAIVLLVIIVVAAASSGVKPKVSTVGLATCTVNGQLGMKSVQITNQNTGKSIIKTAADLPYTFNLTKGDTLRFNVTTLPGYLWNSWEMNASPWFAQDNPLLIRVSTDVSLTAKVLVEEER